MISVIYMIKMIKIKIMKIKIITKIIVQTIIVQTILKIIVQTILKIIVQTFTVQTLFSDQFYIFYFAVCEIPDSCFRNL